MSLARQFLREMRPLFRLLEDPVGRMPATYGGFPSNALSRMADFDNLIVRPAIDVSDMGDKYVVEADLPGVSKENLDIRIGDNRQSITIEGKVTERAMPNAEAEQQSTGETVGECYEFLGVRSSDFLLGGASKDLVSKDSSSSTSTQLAVERPFTRNVSFSRSVWLPRRVDPSRVTARLTNGVLTVAVNKEVPDKGTSIQITD